jgi:hypothetical protein
MGIGCITKETGKSCVVGNAYNLIEELAKANVEYEGGYNYV